MQLTIEVTEEDIREGKRCDCDECPVALAWSRAAGCQWDVGTKSAGPTDTGAWAHRVPLPPVAATFVRMFDDDLYVKPFSFTVDIPKELESYIKVPA